MSKTILSLYFAAAILFSGNAFANDILAMNDGGIYRFNGNTGASEGWVTSSLETPQGLAYGTDGTLYVAGNALGNGHLQSDNTVYPIYQMPNQITLGPDGHLYGTSNHFSGSGVTGVVRFNGLVPSTFVANGAGGITSAWDIDFGPDGNLYLTQGFAPASNNVLRYNGTTGAFIDTFASGNGLSGAGGFTFGPDGDLYVASYNSNSVLRFNGTTGAFESTFISSGSGGLDEPTDLKFGNDGLLYVISSFNSQILRYNASSGAFVDDFINLGDADHATFMSFVLPEPGGLALCATVAIFGLRRRR